MDYFGELEEINDRFEDVESFVKKADMQPIKAQAKAQEIASQLEQAQDDVPQQKESL